MDAAIEKLSSTLGRWLWMLPCIEKHFATVMKLQSASEVNASGVVYMTQEFNSALEIVVKAAIWRYLSTAVEEAIKTHALFS